MRASACLLVITAVLAGCGGNPAPPPRETPSSSPPPVAEKTVAAKEPHSLVYSATGTAAVTSITYELDGQPTTLRSVKLPWRKVLEIPADGKRHDWRVAINHRDGRAELIAIFDGSVVGRSAGQVSGGSGTVSASGNVRG